jgi:hypothetical protein
LADRIAAPRADPSAFHFPTAACSRSIQPASPAAKKTSPIVRHQVNVFIGSKAKGVLPRRAREALLYNALFTEIFLRQAYAQPAAALAATCIAATGGRVLRVAPAAKNGPRSHQSSANVFTLFFSSRPQNRSCLKHLTPFTPNTSDLSPTRTLPFR